MTNVVRHYTEVSSSTSFITRLDVHAIVQIGPPVDPSH